MSTTDELQRLFTSYGNAMYRNDPDAAEKIAAKFSAALAQQPAASGESVALWHLSGHGYAPVTKEQSHPPEPLTWDEAIKIGWRPFYAAPQPAPARVPLTDQQLCSMRKENLADDDSPAWAYEKGVRDAENAHGVTQGEPK